MVSKTKQTNTQKKASLFVVHLRALPLTHTHTHTYIHNTHIFSHTALFSLIASALWLSVQTSLNDSSTFTPSSNLGIDRCCGIVIFVWLVTMAGAALGFWGLPGVADAPIKRGAVRPVVFSDS